jgi:hypothetical protein
MANLLQSTQTTETTAPQFYTDYLSNIASRGQAAQQAAQYVGAQPLQQQAYTQIGQTAGTFQPVISSGEQLAQQAGGQDITGAAAPYLAAGTAISPLSALAPFAQNIAASSPADLASAYMSPYIGSAVQNLSDIAQRNIQQNIDPQATAAAVGTGQFGSQRGAQVLGQVERQAQQDLESQISQMLNAGYGQALTAAGQYQGTLGQLGSTAANAQNAYNQALLNAGQTAGSTAQAQAAAQNTAAQTLGTLGTQAQTMNLADINALANLGGQQQQILQNQQNYPLTTLASLANLLQGAQVPTTVTAALNQSPLSLLAGVGTAGLGAITPQIIGYNPDGTPKYGASPLDAITAGLQKTFPSIFGTTAATPTTSSQIPGTIPGNPTVSNAVDSSGSSLYQGSDGNYYYSNGTLYMGPTPTPTTPITTGTNLSTNPLDSSSVLGSAGLTTPSDTSGTTTETP